MKISFFIVFVAGFYWASASPTDSLENALKTSAGETKVKILNELFRAYIYKDPVKAVTYCHEALQFATSINDQKGMAASCNNLGVAYRNQGALDEAIENYIRSLELYTGISNAEGIATTKNNIANIYSMKKDFAQALKYFEESHKEFVTLGNAEKIIGSLNNLGNLHSDLQLYDQAMNYYTEAWSMSEKSESPFPDPLMNMGNLFYKQGNSQRAVEYYERALTIVRTQDNAIGELALLANIGEAYSKANQSIQAQRYLDQAMAMADKLQASVYVPQILKSMATNYSRQGKMKEAYETFLDYDNAREKIYSEESSRRIAQMNVAIQLRDKEKELDALQLDDQIKTLKLHNTEIIITSVVLGIVALVAFTNLYLMSRRIRTMK